MVDGFRIKGKTPLNGVIKVSGAKNAALPIIIATLVAKGEYILRNVPNLRDIRVTMRLLEDLGMETEKLDENTYKIINNGFKRTEASYEIVKQMRASFLVMGPMIANLDEAVVFFDYTNSFDIHFINRDSLKEKRLVSLSNYGFYILLIKLSIHFTRVQEKVQSN